MYRLRALGHVVVLADRVVCANNLILIAKRAANSVTVIANRTPTSETYAECFFDSPQLIIPSASRVVVEDVVACPEACRLRALARFQ